MAKQFTDLKITVRVPSKDVYKSPKKLERIIRSSDMSPRKGDWKISSSDSRGKKVA